MSLRPDFILIVEDNDDHAFFIQKAFVQARLANPTFRVSDGDEAIEYLKGEGKYSNRCEYPVPGLVLLDLKMPRRNGFEVLEWIRQQPGFKGLRVVVLTTSEELREVNRAYELGANSFLVKPVTMPDFMQLVEAVNAYWVLMSAAPESSRSIGEKGMVVSPRSKMPPSHSV
ncbi:MAG: response regulator [Limisphaerales bacterium]